MNTNVADEKSGVALSNSNESPMRQAPQLRSKQPSQSSDEQAIVQTINNYHNVKTLKLRSTLKTTHNLLESFLYNENVFSLEYHPVFYYGHEQIFMTINQCFQQIKKQTLNYNNIRFAVYNLLALHDICLNKNHAVAQRLAALIKQFISSVGELARTLEILSNVNLTDWKLLEDSMINIRNDNIVHTDYIRYIPQVKDFEPIMLLGAGGFGTVYKSRYAKGNYICTVKIIPQQRFNKTRKACIDKTVAAIIDNPFLVKYFLCFSTQEAYVTVMEYISGVDLTRVLKIKRYLNNSEARIIAAQLIVAVEHLHLRGIMHRDIKSTNVLIEGNGHLHLFDFDTCKLCIGRFSKHVSQDFFSRTADEFHDKRIAGTISYMSPEVIQQQPYGRSCDWWSVGVLMFKLITGRMPFRGQTKEDIRESISAGTLEWPRRKFEISHETKDFTEKLLQRNPRRRLGSKSYQEIENHVFFKGFEWEKLANTNNIMPLPDVQIAQNKTKPRGEEKLQVEADTSKIIIRENSGFRSVYTLDDLRDEHEHQPMLNFATDEFKRFMDTTDMHISTGRSSDDLQSSSSMDKEHPDEICNVPENLAQVETRTPVFNNILVTISATKVCGISVPIGLQTTQRKSAREKSVIYVRSIWPKSVASFTEMIRGDVILRLNERSVDHMTWQQFAELLNNAPEKRLTILRNNTLRTITTKRAYVKAFQNASRIDVTIRAPTWCCFPGSYSSSFDTIERCVWDDERLCFHHVHIVVDIQTLLQHNASGATKQHEVYLGDIIEKINGQSVNTYTTEHMMKMIKVAKSNINLTLLPTSPLRKNVE